MNGNGSRLSHARAIGLSAGIDPEKAAHRLRSTIARLTLEVSLLGPGPEAAETRRRLLNDVAEMEAALRRVEEPAPSAQTAEDGSRASRPSLASLAARHVVVADDDRRFADLVARRLGDLGFAVAAVSTAHEANDQWSEGAVLVLDLSLVEEAQGDVRESLLRRRPVILTGASEAAAAEALAGWDVRVVSKLAPFADLLDAIEAPAG